MRGDERVTPEALRHWRVRMELSQRQASALYGISQRQWCRYEASDTPVPPSVLHWMRLWEHHDRHEVTVDVKTNLR